MFHDIYEAMGERVGGINVDHVLQVPLKFVFKKPSLILTVGC